jgi:Permuted papain-like amidase enzyme, YaeF/YiiX, C92 family
MNRVAMVLAYVAAMISSLAAQPREAPLAEGDLIFQNSRSTQSAAILGATGSRYTHMGIIVRRGGEFVVLEAGPTVREAPLGTWIASGADGAHAVYRREGLGDERRVAVIEAARRYLGRPYDIFFDFEGEAIYCSELPYLAFGVAGIPIGTVQTVSELNLRSAAAQGLIRERWRKHPRCAGLGQQACVAAIMAQKLITPASIAADPQFRLIHSTFKTDATR